LQYLDWQPADSLQVLNFPFPVEKSGRYKLYAQFAKGEKYGQVQVLIDGKRVGEVIDFSGEGLAASGEVEVGDVRLMQRLDHKIAFMSKDGKAIGVDYFILRAPAKPTDSDNSNN